MTPSVRSALDRPALRARGTPGYTATASTYQTPVILQQTESPPTTPAANSQPRRPLFTASRGSRRRSPRDRACTTTASRPGTPEAPSDCEQRRERRDRRRSEPPRDQVDARQVREEQKEHRRPEPEQIPAVSQKTPAFTNETPPVYARRSRGAGQLTNEHALRALGERAVVPRAPAVVQLRRDEDRAGDETDDRHAAHDAAPSRADRVRAFDPLRRMADDASRTLVTPRSSRPRRSAHLREPRAREIGAPTGDAHLSFTCSMGLLDTSASTPASMTAISRHVPLPRAHVPWTIR